MSEDVPVVQKPKRGFATLSPERQRELASKGGKAAHAPGAKGHHWSPEAAREAGRKGGLASRGGRGKLPGTGTL